ASFQAVSAGRVRGGIFAPLAAGGAAAPSGAAGFASRGGRPPADIRPARPPLSEGHRAVVPMWYGSGWPTMLTMPELAFLALCRLARPLARPGPRCSRVEAGVPFMR